MSVARESGAVLRQLLDSIEDPVWTKDAEGYYLYVNPAHAKASDRTPEEMIGKTVGELFDEVTASKIANDDSSALLGETVIC